MKQTRSCALQHLLQRNTSNLLYIANEISNSRVEIAQLVEQPTHKRKLPCSSWGHVLIGQNIATWVSYGSIGKLWCSKRISPRTNVKHVKITVSNIWKGRKTRQNHCLQYLEGVKKMYLLLFLKVCNAKMLYTKKVHYDLSHTPENLLRWRFLYFWELARFHFWLYCNSKNSAYKRVSLRWQARKARHTLRKRGFQRWENFLIDVCLRRGGSR